MFDSKTLVYVRYEWIEIVVHSCRGLKNSFATNAYPARATEYFDKCVDAASWK